MNTQIKAQVCELFKEFTSIDYIRETLPNENVDDIIELLINENLLVNRPKKQYMAGVLTYVVSDEDILPRVKFALANGTPKRRICKQFHIGGTRLNKLIKKYELQSNEQPITGDQIEEPVIVSEPNNLTEQQEPTIEKEVEEPTIEKEVEEPTIEKEVEARELKTNQTTITTTSRSNEKLSDSELKPIIDKGLQEGRAKKHIAKELHISLKRLNRIANTSVENLATSSIKATTITTKLIGQVQTYLRYDAKPEIIAKNLSISVNAVKTIKKLLKLTKVPEGKETTESQTPTLEEKIVYANQVYGVGKWKFLSRDECLRLWKEKQTNEFGDIDNDFDDF